LGQHLDQLTDDTSEASQRWDREHDELVIARLLEQVRGRFEEKTWRAFELSFVEGLAASHVANELDIKVDKVYVAKSRVLRAIRTLSSGLTA